MPDHNRIVTPDTDPDRFTAEETQYFRLGWCAWVIEDGLAGIIRCGKPSEPGASFGDCAEHNAKLLEDHYPDGTRR